MKIRQIFAIIFTAIVALMVIFSGIMKLIKKQEVVEKLSNVGVGSELTYLGLIEVIFAVLFVFPKTMKIGLLLLTAYFGGAMATELSHNGPAQNAAIPLMVIWVAAFLRDSSIFLAKPEPRL